MSQFRSEIEKLAAETILTNKEIAKIVGCSERTVRRYVGSHADRCKEKVLQNTPNPFKVYKAVLLPDIHYPNYLQRVMDAINDFIADYDPDELIYMGDQLSLDAISIWNQRKPLLREGQRLLKEYEGFNTAVLLPHEKITRPDCRRVFIIGNHEYRVQRYCEEHPELSGLIDIERNLRLRERGYIIIPYNKIYKLGKLSIIHGYYWNKYHAAKTLDVFEGNVVYAHTHNPQSFAKASPIDQKGYHVATGLGCICNVAPAYKQGKPTSWINQFGIVEFFPASGYYNLYPITINEGSFMYNGKMYGKRIED